MTIIFHSFLFLFIIYLNGFIFLKDILKFKKVQNFYEVSIIGLVVTIIVAHFLNFFIPLNDFLVILNVFLLLFYIVFFRKNFKIDKKVDFKILSILLILSFLNIYGSNFSDDLNHYHYSSISNADSNNFIWGLNFLHPLYGTSSSWLIGHSYFNFEEHRLQDIHVLNGIIFFLVIGCFFAELYSGNKKKIYHPIFFSILLFILLKYTRLKEFGIDRPSTLIFCFLIYFYLKYFINIEKKEITQNFIIVILLSLFLFSTKIIHLPILLIPLFILYKNKSNLLKIDKKYLIILLPIFVIILKNLLGTGCFFYPVEITCTEYLPWTDRAGVREFVLSSEIFNKSWHSYKGGLSGEEYIQNFNWITAWYLRIQSEIIEIFLTLTLIIVFSFFIFDLKSKKLKSLNVNLKNFKILLFFIIIFSSIIFLKNPVIRMYHFTLISFMILIITLIFKFDIKTYRSKFASIVLIIAVIFNSYKNFIRISENNFLNNPYAMISPMINKQEKKYISTFTYYLGWYGNAPVAGQSLKNKNHKKILIFDIIY